MTTLCLPWASSRTGIGATRTLRDGWRTTREASVLRRMQHHLSQGLYDNVPPKQRYWELVKAYWGPRAGEYATHPAMARSCQQGAPERHAADRLAPAPRPLFGGDFAVF
jgi:hypothetical protein